ncbi:MAG: glutaredoxin family protein [Gammaproteobacteria bacterium]
MKNNTGFSLYTKPGCCLCDIFKASLDEHGVSYQLVDISDDPDLNQRYGARIPVLVTGDREVCEGRYDEQTVAAYM